MLRCPLCAGLDHSDLCEEYLCCKICSLGFKTDSLIRSLDAHKDPTEYFVFDNWNNWFTRITFKLPSPQLGSPCYFSPYTVRMFAAREGRRATQLDSTLPLLPVYAPWQFGKTIRARVEPVPATQQAKPDPRLTLGIIAALPAWDDVLALWNDMLDCAMDIIVVLDTAEPAIAAALEGELASRCGNASERRCRVKSHPLNRDFAAQRNRVQRAARTEWILQLDCDERLTSGSKRSLSHVIDDAEREGWAAVALTRRNLVDGTVSAFYPDVQYRLLRRLVPFMRAVHEYPQLNRSQHSFVHLGLGIVHNVASVRLEQRSARYEEIQAGAGRPHDAALLRMPLQDGVTLVD